MGGGESLIYKMVKIPGCLYAYGDDPVGGAIGTVGQKRETSDVLEKTGRGEILSQAEGLALHRVHTVVHQYHQAGCLCRCLCFLNNTVNNSFHLLNTY